MKTCAGAHEVAGEVKRRVRDPSLSTRAALIRFGGFKDIKNVTSCKYFSRHHQPQGREPSALPARLIPSGKIVFPALHRVNQTIPDTFPRNSGSFYLLKSGTDESFLAPVKPPTWPPHARARALFTAPKTIVWGRKLISALRRRSEVSSPGFGQRVLHPRSPPPGGI